MFWWEGIFEIYSFQIFGQTYFQNFFYGRIDYHMGDAWHYIEWMNVYFQEDVINRSSVCMVSNESTCFIPEI